MDPKVVLFGPFFSDIIFGTASARNGGLLADKIVSENGVWISFVRGFHRPWEGTSVVTSRKQQYETHPSAKQTTVSTACCAALPTRARFRHHHEPMGLDCDGIDHESHATLLAVAIGALAQQQLVSLRTRAVAIWEKYVHVVRDQHRPRGGKFSCKRQPSK